MIMYVCIIFMSELFLKHSFEGNDGRRLNTIWYFGPHFWAKNVRDFLGDELQ